MWAVVKQCIFGVPEANRADGAGPGGVLRVQVGCFVVSELWAMVRKGGEMGIWPLLTDMSRMTWQAMWMCEALWWARCA
jgi:hypothetical protein